MNMQRENPFDRIDGLHLREAIAFFTRHHGPSLYLDAALISAAARRHGPPSPVLYVRWVSTPELVKATRSKCPATAFTAEHELRNRVNDGAIGPSQRSVASGHLHQSYSS
jgi:hypothetical protein